MKIQVAQLAATIAAVGLGGTALAQSTPPETTPPKELPAPGSDLKFTIAAGYQYIAETDFQGPGNLEASRAGAELKTRFAIARDFRLELNLRFLFDSYDFGNATTLDPLNGDPWDDIQTLEWDGRMEWWMTNDIALIGGPFLMWSRESSANWSDSFTGGAFAGVMFISSRKLVWGGGIGISTQIRDDLLVYPIIFLDWKITDDLKLTSVAGPIGLAYTGFELVYDLGQGFETGLGFRYEFRRFRLGPTGLAPDGVGVDKGWPLWGRITYKFNQNFQVDLYGGVILGGRFKVDDFNGQPVTRDDLDPAPTAALTLRVNF